MAIKTERRMTGVAGAGSLPSVGFGSADVGSGLMRAGMSLLRQSQAKSEQNASLNDYLAGQQAAYDRPVMDDQGRFTAPAYTDPGQSDNWNRGYIAGIKETRFDMFQNGALERVNQILTDPSIVTAAEKQAALADFGATYFDKVGVHEGERGRWGNWLNNTIQDAGRRAVSAENQVKGRLEIEGAEARIKRRMDELTNGIQTGNPDLTADAMESINNDFDFLEGRMAISPDKRKAAQTQMFELARVTGMSRQIGGALVQMQVDPSKVDAFLDAVENGSDYKLEWTDREGRKWEVDTKKLDVADPGLRNMLIKNLNGTKTRMAKVWSDMAEGQQLLEFIETKDPTVALTSEQKTKVNKMLTEVMQGSGVENDQTWGMIAHWSSRAGYIPETVTTTLVGMMKAGDAESISRAAQAWNSLRNAVDPKTGKAIGNQLAGSISDEDRNFLNSIADGIGLGHSPEKMIAVRDKMFAGDPSVRETSGDAFKAWGQLSNTDDDVEKSLDAELLNRWNTAFPDKRDWIQRGMQDTFDVQVPSVTIGKTIGGVGVEFQNAPTRMPPWWKDAVKQAYVYNYMIDPSNPKTAMDLAVKQVMSQTKVSPIYKDGAARVVPGMENLEVTDSWKDWLKERGKDMIERGDGYDQLEEFTISEMGLDDLDALSPDIPMISTYDLLRIQETGTPKLGDNLKLHRIGGDNENPQFEVWFKDKDNVFLPVKAVDGNNLLIQPAGEWRYRQDRITFDKKMKGLQGAQQGEIDKLQAMRDEAFMKRVSEYMRLNPDGLPGKDLISKFNAEAMAEVGWDGEVEAIEQGFRERMDQLELSAPEPPVTPKTSTPDPIVQRVRAVVGGNGEEAVTPYQPTGEPTVNSPETGPWQGEVPKIESFLVPGKDKSHAKLAPELADPLARLLADAKAAGHDVQIFSGYRSVEHQRDLWNKALKKYGSAAAARKHVAPPGRSQHNHGGAADLSYNGSALDGVKGLTPEQRAAQEWVHANAGKYGLHFRMGHEPWHIERAEGGKVASIKDSATPARSGDPYQLLTVANARGKNVAWTAAKAIDAVLPDGTGGHFLVNMASTESQFGEAPGTFRLKGDRGIWQINRGGAFAEVHRQLGIPGSKVQKAAAKLKETYGLDVASIGWDDLDKPLHSAAFSRLYMIARGKEQIPTDVNAQAAIWKKYYNTVAGAGKMEHFIQKAVPAPQQEARGGIVGNGVEFIDAATLIQQQADERWAEFPHQENLGPGLIDKIKLAIQPMTSMWGDDEPEEISMENVFIGSRTVPDLTSMDAFEKLANEDIDKGKYSTSEIAEVTEALFPRTHFEGDAKLMAMNMVYQAKDNPLMRAALKNLAGSRMVLVPQPKRYGPSGQDMGRRYYMTSEQEALMGFYNPNNRLLVAPDPKHNPEEAVGTIYHEALHKLFHEKTMKDPNVPPDLRARLDDANYHHAIVNALQNEADSSAADKKRTAERVDIYLTAALGTTNLPRARALLARDLDRLKEYYGG